MHPHPVAIPKPSSQVCKSAKLQKCVHCQESHKICVFLWISVLVSIIFRIFAEYLKQNAGMNNPNNNKTYRPAGFVERVEITPPPRAAKA